MKYKNPVTGEFKDLHVKAVDTLPVGSVVDYEGTEVPAGWEEVEEEGTNDNGSWVKFTNGTMICRATKRVTNLVTSIPTGGIIPVSAEVPRFTFPVPFIDKPQVHMEACRYSAWLGYEWTPTNEATSDFVVYTPTPMTIAYIDIQYTAIGKWKGDE